MTAVGVTGSRNPYCTAQYEHKEEHTTASYCLDGVSQEFVGCFLGL